MGEGMGRPFWMDQDRGGEGFSTAGMAIALIVTLSLVFTGAQVYRVQSASAEVQEVADAAALAADNAIAEFYLVARVCDALVLSLSITGIVVVGVGVAALCTPVSAGAGAKLIEAGGKVLKARDRFARRAAQGLERLQAALPFLAAANAARVAAANRSPSGAGYLGVAIVLPAEGEAISAGQTGAGDELADAAGESADELRDAAQEAEDAAREAREAKERAYRADCGASPGYCLEERAASLAGLSGADNPHFSNVDTWGFSVALERAKKYYAQRLAIEAPSGSSVEEQANSALRTRFYRYAVDAVGAGWVRESGESFSADFPLLPRNTAEMRETALYTEAVYPVGVNGAGQCELHAWAGCPQAAGAEAVASLAEAEAGGYASCIACRFGASSLGKVAAASSSIANGFEYHYRIVAEAAREYQKAREAAEPKARKVRRLAESLFEKAEEALQSMAAQRIEVSPPGRLGVVAIVASTQSMESDLGFSSAFVDFTGALGARVAISGATLASDTPEAGRNVIASALDGVRERGDFPAAGVLDRVADVWGAALFAYADGQRRVGEGLQALDSRIPFQSESGLGAWASRRFGQAVESLGLEPGELDAPKPVLVNTGHVLQADSGAFSARLLSVKRAAAGLSGGNVLESVIGSAEGAALRGIEGLGGSFTVAEVEIAGVGGEAGSIPLTIGLPNSAQDAASGAISSLADRLRGIAGDITGERQWR